MALEINDQYDFFQNVQIDDDGNLLVSIVNGGSGGTGVNYYTTGATLDGTVVTFGRNDNANAYSVDLFDLEQAMNNIDGGSASATQTSFIDGGIADSLMFNLGIDGGDSGCGLFIAYKSYVTDVLTSGSTYTFVDPINVISIPAIDSLKLVNLPSNPTRNYYIVKDKGGNTVDYPIIVSGGTQTINGESTYTINLPNKPSLTFLFDGQEYITI